MIDTVSKPAAGASQASAPTPAAAAPPAGASASAGAVASSAPAPCPRAPSLQGPQVPTRLLVEPDGAQGFVYRLVDAATGRVLMELPRGVADELKADPGYSAGDLVSRSI